MHDSPCAAPAPASFTGAQSCTLGPSYPTKSCPPPRQPPPKAHNRAPSTAIRRHGAAPARGNRHRGSNIVHPRPKLPHQKPPHATVIATEGAESCTLGPSYPTKSRPPPRQPPPRAHNRAYSTPVTPPETGLRHGNRHRGRTIVHPRSKLPHQKPSSATATATEGAQPRTLAARQTPDRRSGNRTCPSTTSSSIEYTKAAAHGGLP